MPAKFIPDSKRGPGNGLIVVNPISCQTAPTFALYRSSDRLCLSEQGWQSSEVFLSPRTWNCHNDALLLAVDDKVVNYLDKLNTYKIVIKEGNAAQAFTLSIEDIVQTTMDGGQGVGMGSCTATAPKITETVPEQNIPENPAPQISEKKLDKITMPTLNTAPQNPAAQKKKRLLIIVFVVLALLACAFWWFMQHGKNIPVPPQAQEQTQVTPQKVKDESKDKSRPEGKDKNKQEEQVKPPEKNTSTPQKSDAMDVARTLLRKNDSGAASKALADSLKAQAQKDVMAQDAIFLLLEDAAQKGEASAMRELAVFYDPTISEGKGSITPDIQQAHAWYAKALDNGDTKAIAALNKLRMWVKKAADDGDITAAELLRKW